MQIRALRHVLSTSVLLLATLAILTVINIWTLQAASDLLGPLTERASATISSTDGRTATVQFAGPNGAAVTTTTPVDEAPASPAVVAYDLADPARVVLPAHPVLLDAARAGTNLSALALLALTCLGVGAQRGLTRWRLTGRPSQVVSVCRVRQQDRLLSRSWVELTGAQLVQRFPVYFDPILVTLASPSRVAMYGNGKLRALRVDGRWIVPSGRVRSTEPRGQLIDNPTRPGADTPARAEKSAPIHRSFLLDSVLLVPAPIIALFWVFIDGSGIRAWAGATLVAAVTTWWVASIIGTDPS